MADPLNALFGGWRLVEFTLTTQENRVVFPLGDQPVGRLYYMRPNLMSAHLMPGGTPPAGAKIPDPPVSLMSYCGRVRIEGDQVIHDVEISSRPGDVGSILVRTKSFDRDRLVLVAEGARAPGVTGIGRLLWERLPTGG